MLRVFKAGLKTFYLNEFRLAGIHCLMAFEKLNRVYPSYWENYSTYFSLFGYSKMNENYKNKNLADILIIASASQINSHILKDRKFIGEMSHLATAKSDTM